MMTKIKKTGRAKPRYLFLQLLLLAAMFFGTVGVFAQSFEFSLNQRRMGDTLGVEIWAKSLNEATTNLGNMNINLVFNDEYLDITGTTAYAVSDSIDRDINQPNPYKTLLSPFASQGTGTVNGFGAVVAQGTEISINSVIHKLYGLSVHLGNGGAGFAPATTGKGSFVGMLKFVIKDKYLDCDLLSEIDFAPLEWGAHTVMSPNDFNDLTSQVEFLSEPDFTIRGITILSPNYPNTVIHRYPSSAYLVLAADNNKGYPIYFERSGLASNLTNGTYGTGRFGYAFEYSLINDGTNFIEFGRAAETDQDATALSSGNVLDRYASGEMDMVSATNAFYMTQANGTFPLTVAGAGYGGVIRVIWKASENFKNRSEQALLRIRQLDTLNWNTKITSRAAYQGSCQMDISDFDFVIGRLFFAQLDGESYYRTRYNYSNATQLTVEAWVNLNSIPDPPDPTANTGIVLSSSGPTTDEEGSWMLYLAEGRYPAFRAKEIEGGDKRGQYVGEVRATDPLCVSDDATPIQEEHSENWYHLAATVQNNIVTLYVNGEIADQYINNNDINIRMLTTNQPIWVGLNPNSIDNPGAYNPTGPNGPYNPNNYLHAGIKEVRVWRYAMTQNELRARMSGVYDPAGSINPIDHSTGDLRASLELAYPFQGFRDDAANDIEYQNNANPLNYYTGEDAYLITADPNNNELRFRPDKSHIRLTSPAGGEGVSNLKDKIYPIRWAAYGLGSLDNSSADLQVYLSRDGGHTWFDAIGSDNAIMESIDIEAGEAYWEPYRNATISDTINDLQGLLPIVTEKSDRTGNYDKKVIMKISGTELREQTDIASISEPFTVAPYFALGNMGSAYVKIPATRKINMSGGIGFLEAWVKPYRFPLGNEGEEYFPILSKKNDEAPYDIHYALRLLPTGQLQFVVGSITGTELRTVTSDARYPIIPPNDVVFDSVWVHVGVWFNLANGGNASAKFYVDGKPFATQDFEPETDNITTINDNKFPAYLGYEPLGNDYATPHSFIGEIKEVRFWGNNPAGQSHTGVEPSALTRFIQGALSVRADELGAFAGTDYAQHLQAAFMLNGGDFLNNGYLRGLSAYPVSTELTAIIIPTSTTECGTIYGGLVPEGTFFAAQTPVVKLVEPVYQQDVANTKTDLRVRWVGFDYNRNDQYPSFYNGSDASNHADLQFSVKGGGGMNWRPYQYVASKKFNPGFVDAMTLFETDNNFAFQGVNSPSQYAVNLDFSKTDPELDGAGVFTNQGPVPATMANGRLQLRGRATINGSVLEFDNFENGRVPTLITETEIFNITPPSNFTVRVLLEGYHLGNSTAFTSNLGTTFGDKGLRIALFDDNSNTPGAVVENSVKESAEGYYNSPTTKDPTAGTGRGNDGSNFANVPFVFTQIADNERYFVVLDHLNHLPVMSRYAAPFVYAGDDFSTWAIESGWDFQNWNASVQNNVGISQNEAGEYPPLITDKFTAYGNAESDRQLTGWGSTGLNWNDGMYQTGDAPMAAMVGGDAEKNYQIDAADRARVRSDAGGAMNRSDITGDGLVNHLDRNIVDNNTNKMPSIPENIVSAIASIDDAGVLPAAYITGTDPLDAYLADAPEMSSHIIEATKLHLQNGGEYLNRTPAMLKKHDEIMAGGLRYKVYATPVMNGSFIDVPFYIVNEGEKWGLGHSTFGITYDLTTLTFDGLIQTDDVIFSNKAALGYFASYSAPLKEAGSPIPDLRTIEIDYDAFTRLGGQLVPNSPTYLGTLRFKVISQAIEYYFDWHKEITGVLTTESYNVTGNGEFLPIPAVLVPKSTALISPNGGESWVAGRSYPISWTKPTNSFLMNIDYSTDNGATWFNISKNVDVAVQSYNWFTPKVSSTECLVRIVDASSSLEVDRSTAVFSLLPSEYDITRPSSKDPIYSGGASDFIRWTTSDALNIRFEFSENGYTDWVAISPVVNSNSEQVAWTIPSVDTKDAVVRMVNATNGEVLTQTGRFRILAGSLKLTNPKAGDQLSIGAKVPVRWIYNNVNKFDLQFSYDGGESWQFIAQAVLANKNSQQWTVPNYKTPNAVIRAIWNGDPTMEYSRVEGFSIGGEVSVIENEENGFVLNMPVPNPFSGQAQLTFSIPFNEQVFITMFNANGMKVMDLIDGVDYAAGTHTVMLYGNDLPAGSYYIYFRAGNFTTTREVIRMK